MPTSIEPADSSTPPPLYHSPSDSDRGRESSATSDNTPIHTPTVSEAPWPPQSAPPKKERDLYFSWHKKQGGAKSNGNPLLGADWHFGSDTAESCFETADDDASPLYPDSPPLFQKRSMATASPPSIDVQLPPRLASSQSPRNQTSNLTSALQEAGATAQQFPDATNTQFLGAPLSLSGRNDSISNLLGSSYYGGSGARPISMKDRARRESNTAGSLVGGMSWGGISVGSMREDLMMTGTSPMVFGAKSPSLHSNSYLPRMEAQFLSGYVCCGKNLDSLHDLLQHFEENHAQQSSQVAHRASVSSQTGFQSSRRPSNGNAGSQIITPADQRAMNPPRQGNGGNLGFNRSQLSTVQDMDSLEDMEMDDAPPDAGDVTSMSQMTTAGASSGHGLSPLTTSMAPAVPAQQAFRTSTPTTPNPNAAFQLYGNPTVSSVNTPTMSTQSLSQQSPHTAMSGTQAAGDFSLGFDTNFRSAMGMGMDMGVMNLGMPNNTMMGDDFDFGPIGFGLANNMGDMTIDEPAKRLFSKAGSMNAQQLALALKNGQLPVDVEMQKKLREQQLITGMGGPVVGFENKPFKCPVIGCEKAYKNQNGLKYHKQHGHNNQKLQENSDGTFSILDPITSIPYPGTVGMEKEKPYCCDICGKRYKNLNGLKYHKQHTAQCNPDLLKGSLSGLNPNANVAGNLF